VPPARPAAVGTSRIGVDVGGTFTDLVLFDTETNAVHVAKTASTPANQALGVETGVVKIARQYGREPDAVETVLAVRATGVRAVAVCLLHAYANPAHERRLGRPAAARR
jgi:N-methylhydantoinase A/oxoprolinase/acetone carboxylase beta subunit